MDRRTALKVFAGVAGGVALLGGGSRVRSLWADDAASPTEQAKLLKASAGFISAKVGVQHLTPQLTMVIGPGGNIAVLADDDQVVVIDCGVKQRAHDVLKAIRVISNAPRKTLINTHYHFDHTGGNEALAKAGFTIVAQANVRTRMATDQTVAALGLTIPAAPPMALPDILFNADTTIFAGDDELIIHHVAPAHTDGDSYIHFKKSNVIHCGDLYFNGFYPVIDYSAGGNLDGMIDGVAEILKLADAKTQIIPGHGMLSNQAELQTYHDVLSAIAAKIKPMVQAGKTVDEIVAAKPTQEFDGAWGKGIFTPDKFVEVVVAAYQVKMKTAG